jgi:hypothetical protein
MLGCTGEQKIVSMAFRLLNKKTANHGFEAEGAMKAVSLMEEEKRR